LVHATATTGDDEAGKYLGALFFTLAHETVNFYVVTHVELRGVVLELFLLDFVNNGAHGLEERLVVRAGEALALAARDGREVLIDSEARFNCFFLKQ
jgi:hypothetical protein